MSTYTPPVDRLLTLGGVTWGEPWRDYQALGLGPEHQAELIQMLRDMDLHWGDTDSPGVWAPVHAWRALAQMRIAEAVTPYLETLADLEEKDSDDGLMPEELRDFCLAIGEPSLPALIDFVTADGPTYTRGATVDTLAKLAGAYPARRGEVIAVLSGVLARAATNDAALTSRPLKRLTRSGPRSPQGTWTTRLPATWRRRSSSWACATSRRLRGPAGPGSRLLGSAPDRTGEAPGRSSKPGPNARRPRLPASETANARSVDGQAIHALRNSIVSGWPSTLTSTRCAPLPSGAVAHSLTSVSAAM